MVSILSVQQSGQMSGHMTGQSGNQDIILFVTLILGLVIIALVVAFISLFYLFYTGRITFAKKNSVLKNSQNLFDAENDDKEQSRLNKTEKVELPNVSLTPLERKIIEVVQSGHNVLQSDLPNLVNSSKSKVSEALTNLEEKKLIQRFKSGRSLTIKYIFENPV